MKLRAQAGALAATLKAAAGAVDIRAVKRFPILASVLIEATDVLTLSATDLELVIAAQCGCTIEGPGRAAVTAEALTELIGNFAANTEVMIETAESGLQIKAGRSTRYRLPLLAEESFPQFPATTSTPALTLSRDDVQRLFGRTASSIAIEDTRFYLCGGYLHLDPDGRLACTATDGQRLALASSTIIPADGVLPIDERRTVEAILKLARVGDVTLQTDAKVLSVRADNLIIGSRLINGTYPDFRRVLPAKPKAIATLDRVALLEALARMEAINIMVKKPMTLTLSWGGSSDALKLALAGGEAAEDMIAAAIQGAGHIIVHVKRLLKVIESIAADRLVLGIASDTEPLRIQPADADDLLVVLAPCMA
jgi:DNA polymerase-3 subunit beta